MKVGERFKIKNRADSEYMFVEEFGKPNKVITMSLKSNTIFYDDGIYVGNVGDITKDEVTTLIGDPVRYEYLDGSPLFDDTYQLGDVFIRDGFRNSYYMLVQVDGKIAMVGLMNGNYWTYGKECQGRSYDGYTKKDIESVSGSSVFTKVSRDEVFK